MAAFPALFMSPGQGQAEDLKSARSVPRGTTVCEVMCVVTRGACPRFLYICFMFQVRSGVRACTTNYLRCLCSVVIPVLWPGLPDSRRPNETAPHFVYLTTPDQAPCSASDGPRDTGLVESNAQELRTGLASRCSLRTRSPPFSHSASVGKTSAVRSREGVGPRNRRRGQAGASRGRATAD